MTILVSENLQLNQASKQLLIDGKHCPLPALTVTLLEQLLTGYPEPQSIEQLIQGVWHGQVVADETVTQRVALLRKSLKQCGFNSEDAIESLRNQGYRWRLPVNDVVTSPKPQLPAKFDLRRLWLPASLLLIVGALYWLSQSPTFSNKSTQTELRNETLEQAIRYKDKFDARSNEIALSMFEKTYREEPNNLRLLINYSVALSHQVSKFSGSAGLVAKAVELAQQATRVAPENATTWHALAFAYDVQGDIDRAIGYYQKGLSIDPDNHYVKGDLAYLLMQRGQLAQSLMLNYQAMQGGRLYRHLQLAQNLWLLGEDELAEAFFHRGSELYPDSELDRVGQTRYYLLIGHQEKAKALLTDIEKKGVHGNQFLFYQALLALAEGDWQTAHRHLSDSLQSKPNQIAPKVLSNYVLQQWKALQATPFVFEETLFTTQENLLWPEDAVYLAFNEDLRGDFRRAQEVLSWAVEAGFRDTELLNFLPFSQELTQSKGYRELLRSIMADVQKQRTQARGTVASIRSLAL